MDKSTRKNKNTTSQQNTNFRRQKGGPGKREYLLMEDVGGVEDLGHAHSADVFPVGELLGVAQRHGFNLLLRRLYCFLPRTKPYLEPLSLPQKTIFPTLPSSPLRTKSTSININKMIEKTGRRSRYFPKRNTKMAKEETAHRSPEKLREFTPGVTSRLLLKRQVLEWVPKG